jgi:hypothetical protein
MSEQPRGTDGRFTAADEFRSDDDISGDDIPATVWLDRTESDLGAAAETPATSKDLAGKFDAADLRAAGAAEKAQVAAKLKAQLELLEREAEHLGLSPGVDLAKPGGQGHDSAAAEPLTPGKPLAYSTKIKLLMEKIKALELVQAGLADHRPTDEMDGRQLELAQEKMMEIVKDQSGHQMDDKAWHQLRLRFSVKLMQQSVYMVARNYSKTSKELRTFAGRSFEDEFSRLKRMAASGGIEYADCQLDVIMQLSSAHGFRPTCVAMVICEVLTEDEGTSYSQDVKDIILSLCNKSPSKWGEVFGSCEKAMFELDLIQDDEFIESQLGYVKLLPIPSNECSDDSWSYVLKCISTFLSYSPEVLVTKAVAMARFIVDRADHPLIMSRSDTVRQFLSTFRAALKRLRRNLKDLRMESEEPSARGLVSNLMVAAEARLRKEVIYTLKREGINVEDVSMERACKELSEAEKRMKAPFWEPEWPRDNQYRQQNDTAQHQTQASQQGQRRRNRTYRDADSRKVSMHNAQQQAISEESSNRRKGRSLTSDQWKALRAYATAEHKDRRLVDWEEVQASGGLEKWLPSGTEQVAPKVMYPILPRRKQVSSSDDCQLYSISSWTEDPSLNSQVVVSRAFLKAYRAAACGCRGSSTIT